MQNKRLICIILSIVLVICSIATISFYVFADDSNAEGTYKYSSLSKTLEIFSDKAMIDRTEDNYYETPWNEYRNSVEHIIIHNDVTKIGAYAFSKMEGLEDVEIADSVTSIGEAAFAESNNLKELTISNNVSSIGSNAFGFGIDDFQCNCSAGSYAQNWCIQNYIYFNTPFEENAEITTAGKVLYWSFTPATDCDISFYSTGKYDTVGYIYNFETYTYSKAETTMRKSAISYSDDEQSSNLNFACTAKLKAGTKYYLSARLKSLTKTGSFKVNMTAECTSHIYRIAKIDRNILANTKSIISAECIGCGNPTMVDFGKAVTENIDYCDINHDGKVNAKDYAMIIHEKY